MDSGREGVIPLDDKKLKKFAKFININGRYRFFNDDNDLIKIQQETIDQLTNNWNELEEYCLDEQIPSDSIDYNEFIEVRNMAYEDILGKMKEIRREH